MIEKQYLDTLGRIINEGWDKNPKRVNFATGAIKPCSPTRMLPHIFLQHDMRKGFPLFTHRKMPFKSACVELEGFIKGVTDKSWYQERGCKYWDHWSNPFSEDENDLGAIYPHSWRRFGESVDSKDNGVTYGVDQLYSVVHELKKAPTSRRGVVINWTPLQNDRAALPACHIAFIINTCGEANELLNLSFFQRSCDFPRGHNIHTYGLLLELLAQELNKEAYLLSVLYADAHIYEGDLNACQNILTKPTYSLPHVKLPWKMKSGELFDIFKWTHEDVDLVNYQCGKPVKFGEIEV